VSGVCRRCRRRELIATCGAQMTARAAIRFAEAADDAKRRLQRLEKRARVKAIVA